MESHLLQMRGLKLYKGKNNRSFRTSHLLQMRGLKLKRKSVQSIVSSVASFTDAWIETILYRRERIGKNCRIFYRCVD